jgi:hypothetical protein
MEVKREGEQLLLTPKNCGFLSGKVKIQRGHESVSIAASAWILPNFWGMLRGLGAGLAAGSLPLAGALVFLLLALVLGIMVLFSLGPYGINPLGALVPMAAVSLLALGPIPLVMGAVWGAFLQSWRAWLQSVSGTVLGAVLTLLAFHFVHDLFRSTSPSATAVFVEIFILALIWVGAVAMCTGGFRMILTTIPVVLAATSLTFTFAGDSACAAFSDLDQPFREADAWKNVPVNKESPGELLRVFSTAPGMFRSLGWLVNASIYVQLVFVLALPLLMMFVVPISKPAPPRQRAGKAVRIGWHGTPRVVPPAWRKLRL